MPDWVSSLDKFISGYLIPVGWKVAGAIVLWIIGGWVINILGNISRRGMSAQKVDATLVAYAETIIRMALRIVLVIAILSVFGIETTSIAALLAGVGIAVGAAWSGLLSNFAAGAFLIILRPYSVGDFITAGGVTCDVQSIGVFTTTIHTLDNLQVIVGNSKVFADNIINYTTNPYRRVELKAQLSHEVAPQDAMARLRQRLKEIPNVLAEPAPEVDILEFNLAGPVLAVRPFCHNNDYWQVYFDTNRAIHEVCATAGYPVPSTHQVIMHQPIEAGH